VERLRRLSVKNWTKQQQQQQVHRSTAESTLLESSGFEPEVEMNTMTYWEGEWEGEEGGTERYLLRGVGREECAAPAVARPTARTCALGVHGERRNRGERREERGLDRGKCECVCVCCCYIYTLTHRHTFDSLIVCLFVYVTEWARWTTSPSARLPTRH
jgi:hypothetical protein